MRAQVSCAFVSELEQTRPTRDSRAKGLVSSAASGARVYSKTYAPSASVSAWVEPLWVTRWNLLAQQPHRVEMLADPCVTVAFERGSSRVVGVHTRLFRRELTGEGAICAVKFRAGAAQLSLDEPSITALTNGVIPLAERRESWLLALESAVLRASSDEEAIAIIERALVANRREHEHAELAAKIVERVESDPSLTSAAAIARASGLSLRPLQRLFRECVGATPKWVSRQFRLREAAQRLEREDSLTVTELAAALGYADHAHFTRDFKAATGRAPSAFSRAMRAERGEGR